jgi:hypothetical protein
MPYRKFGKNDIRINTLKAHPRSEFLIYDSQIYYNNQGRQVGQFQSASATPGNVYMTETGRVNLYEYNIDRLQGSLDAATDNCNDLIYPYLSKDSARLSFLMTGALPDAIYNNEFAYGNKITGSYPQYATIRRAFIAGASGSGDRDIETAKGTCTHNMEYWSIRNLLNLYAVQSRHYLVTSSLGNKDTQDLNLIQIPSIFYGSQIKPGTVSLKWYYTGSLIAELRDSKENGELIQVAGAAYAQTKGSDKVAGVVLYNEGFILLTGSWILTTQTLGVGGAGGASRKARWKFWGAGCRDGIKSTAAGGSADALNKASFKLGFDGVTTTEVITMYAHARRGEVNYSNNPTFLKYNQKQLNFTSSHVFEENPTRLIKNTVSSSHPGYAANFKRQVYISQIAVYDDNKNLIGIATLPNPVLKEEDQDVSFKLKIDM